MLLEGRNSKNTRISADSLADIAFLLLIFFLVTTTIDVDKGIGLVLPGIEVVADVHPNNLITLLINPDGDVLLDSQPVRLNELKSTIQSRLQNNPNLIVSLKTDSESSYYSYIQVLDQLKQAKLERISIACNAGK